MVVTVVVVVVASGSCRDGQGRKCFDWGGWGRAGVREDAGYVVAKSQKHASQHARKQVSPPASKQTRLQADKPARQQASTHTRQHVREQIRQPASKQARPQAGKPASKQELPQGGMSASQPASKRPSKPAHLLTTLLLAGKTTYLLHGKPLKVHHPSLPKPSP